MTSHDDGIEIERARASLRKLRRAGPPRGVSDFHAAWYRRHTPLLCDFLLDQAHDRELREWTVTFTALHELLGHAYFTWVAAGPVPLEDAWRLYDPQQHIALAPVATLLPPSFVHADHADLYARFVRYLVVRGAVPPVAGRRIGSQYDAIADTRTLAATG
jgi:hypothetical protein